MARERKTTRTTVCEECGNEFDPTEHHPGVVGATLAGAVAGAWVGMQIGIATAGVGIPATIPGTIIGGYSGAKAAKLTTVCPSCGDRQEW